MKLTHKQRRKRLAMMPPTELDECIYSLSMLHRQNDQLDHRLVFKRNFLTWRRGFL